MNKIVGLQTFDKQTILEMLERFSLLGILFFIPISPAAPNLLGIFLIFLWLIKGRYQESWDKVKAQPIFWAFLAYLLLYPLSLLWSENQVWGMHLVERHLIYLLFPFMLMAAKKEDIKYYLAAFVIGMTFTETVSYLMWFDLIHLADAPHPGEPVPFYHHVEYNPMLAWALYLLMHGLFFEKHSLKLKLFFSIFIITMTVNMFITGGRGGQVAYFLIIGLLFLQYFSAKQQLLRGLIIGAGFMASVFVAAYLSSSMFQTRVDTAIHEVVDFGPNSQGSVGSRLHMYINTIDLSFDRSIPEMILGTGIGDFPEDYNKYVGPDEPVKLYANTNGHSHPHNMYLYQLGALGFVGLASLIWLFVALIQVARKTQDGLTHHRWAFLVFMAVIMISDSLLLAHPISVLFIAFSVVLFMAPSRPSETSA